jgi:hypothetical protein
MFREHAPTDPDHLSEWRWLVGPDAELLGWSDSGDLFLTMTDGCVVQLDTGIAELSTIAASEAEFRVIIADPDRSRRLLHAEILEAHIETRGPVPAGFCLGYTILPIFKEGSYALSNRSLVPASEHFSFTGHVHRQLSDVPDGSRVRYKVTE